MSATLIIILILILILILNVVLDAAIIGTLAFVMSRSSKLTPHHLPRVAQRHVQPAPVPSRPRREPAPGRFRPAFD